MRESLRALFSWYGEKTELISKMLNEKPHKARAIWGRGLNAIKGRD